MKKIILLALSFVMILAVAGCAPGKSANEDKMKVGLVLTGPALDGGWNQSAYEGLMALESELGFEVAYTDNIKQSDDESILREYAQQGYDLIIGHGWEYGEALKKVAADYPDIKFAQTGGDAGGSYPNLTSGVFRSYELGYLLGELAAKMTKTNKVGFIGAMELPTIVAEVDTVKATVPFYNPNAKADVVYTGSWTDVAKAKETAKVMLEKGIDVIIGINNQCDAGIIQAIQESEKDAYFIGWSGDWNKAAPDKVLTSGVQSVKTVILLMGQMVKDDKFIAEMVEYGVPENAAILGTWSSVVPAGVKADIEASWTAINKGELNVDQIKAKVGLK